VNAAQKLLASIGVATSERAGSGGKLPHPTKAGPGRKAVQCTRPRDTDERPCGAKRLRHAEFSPIVAHDRAVSERLNHPLLTTHR
jgi:hypothetical protein